LNIEKLGSSDLNQLSKLFLSLSKGESESRDAIDKIVFDSMKLSNSERKKILDSIVELKMAQTSRKEINVLVETSEKWKPHKKPKKEILTPIEPSKRLDKWMDK